MAKKPFILLILIFFLTGFVQAKSGNFINPQKYILKNGMKVLLQEEHSHPITTIQIYLKSGSASENSRNNGISHLIEHLFFRHINKDANADFKTSLEELGSEFNGETTKDYTCFYITLPSKNAKKALSLMADAYLNFSFLPSALESEKKIVLNEYGIYKDNIMSSVIDKLNTTAFGPHPYSLPVIGTENNIKNFTQNDIKEYMSKFYTPLNTTIIIVGDFNSLEIIELTEDLFKNFTSPQINTGSQNFTINTAGREITEEKDIDNYYLAIGYKTPGIKSYNQIYAIDIIAFLLGQGNSLFVNTLVNEKKLAQELDVSFTTSKDPGLFFITAVCKPKKYNDLMLEISNILNKVKTGNFSDEAFERAKNLLIGIYTYTNETNLDKAKTLGFYDTLDSFEFACTYIERIKNVTKSDIVKEANVLFASSPYLVAYKPIYIPDENPQKEKIPFPFSLFNW